MHFFHGTRIGLRMAHSCLSQCEFSPRLCLILWRHVRIPQTPVIFSEPITTNPDIFQPIVQYCFVHPYLQHAYLIPMVLSVSQPGTNGLRIRWLHFVYVESLKREKVAIQNDRSPGRRQRRQIFAWRKNSRFRIIWQVNQVVERDGWKVSDR